MSSLRDQLESVRGQFGRLTPSTVIAAATPDDSPLHARYEWNDSVAGHKYRLSQAAEDIRSVRVTYAQDDTGPRSVRAFLAVRADQEAATREYVPTEDVLSDPFQRMFVLREMERDFNAFRDRYSHLAEYAALIAHEVEAAA